jgi:hypothetical protein
LVGGAARCAKALLVVLVDEVWKLCCATPKPPCVEDPMLWPVAVPLVFVVEVPCSCATEQSWALWEWHFGHSIAEPHIRCAQHVRRVESAGDTPSLGAHATENRVLET